MHEVLPAGTIAALLVNPNNPNAERQTTDARAVAGKMRLQMHVVRATAEGEFPRVFATLAELRVGGLVIGPDGLFLSRSEQLAALALSHAVPVVFASREFAAAGGLISYGNSLTQFYHQTGVYCGLVLKGAHVADLPVFQSRKIELFLNLRTAKLLDLKFSPALLGRANEVIV